MTLGLLFAILAAGCFAAAFFKSEFKDLVSLGLFFLTLLVAFV